MGTPPPANDADAIVSLSEAEREHILAALRQSNWVIDGPSGAAPYSAASRLVLVLLRARRTSRSFR